MTVTSLLQRALADLASPHAPDATAAQSTPCTGVAYDSRIVEPGQVFVALRGQRADGSAFAAQAVQRGAAAVVSEAAPPNAVTVPWIIVSDARLALARLAAEFYEHPSHGMRVVGVTGTNGKTTTAYLLASIFEAAGVRCGLMGTVEYRAGTTVIPATRTTPEAPEVQGYLRKMADVGCGACAMEVSSHALVLRRVDGIHFAAGVFTNLTRDHLDFHGSMEEYFAAKRRLFEMLPADAPALVNLDDPRGASLLEVAPRPVTYAIGQAADVTPGPLTFSLSGLSFDVRCAQGLVRVRSRLVGKPNVYNILGAVGVAAELGIPLPAIEAGLESLSGVPGRFEVVSAPTDDVTVVVDYAHTDDALRNLLETARPMAPRLVTVFGAGGERDRTKRPLMGMVAARLSDVVLVTSDNPRSEDPSRIIEEVMLGAEPEIRQRPVKVLTMVDRADAIRLAVREAIAGDLILIAGKGHEKTQEMGGVTHPFDDIAMARVVLAERRVSPEEGWLTGVALTAAWIAHAVAGELRGRYDGEVREVVTDSRALAAGDLFVALTGPRFDGHDFVETAFDRGAAVVVVSRAWAAGRAELLARGAALVVDDPLRALQALARAVRRAVATRVVAITGSAGKTTTKELTAGALEPTFTVARNKGNLNNHIGLPLSLMQLRGGPDMAVLELGMNHAGEIRTLVGIAEPEVRVWTNVGDAHLGFFSSSDAIADAKAEILEGANASSLLVCSADDARITARRGAFAGRTVTFGESPAADVRAIDIQDRGLDGTSATVVSPRGAARFTTPLLGRANLANVLAAAAVATECGVPIDAVRDRVAAIGPAERRGAVRRLKNDITVIDDSYNSSPAALTQALRTLAGERRTTGRIAVLGEMLELGDHADALHAECGRVAASAGLRALYVVGGTPAAALARAAVDAGMAVADVQHLPSSQLAADAVAASVRPGDVVLVKGSRGIKCDVVVDRLVQERG